MSDSNQTSDSDTDNPAIELFTDLLRKDNEIRHRSSARHPMVRQMIMGRVYMICAALELVAQWHTYSKEQRDALRAELDKFAREGFYGYDHTKIHEALAFMNSKES